MVWTMDNENLDRCLIHAVAMAYNAMKYSYGRRMTNDVARMNTRE